MKPVITIDILVTATSGRHLEMSRQEIENPIKNLQTCWTSYKSVFEREEPHYIKRFQIFYKTTRCFDSFRGLRVKYFVTDDFWVGTYLKNRGATEIMKFSTLINLIKGGVTI